MARFNGVSTSEAIGRDLLDRIQAGVLKGHGRQYTRLLIIKLDNRVTPKRFLKSLDNEVVLQSALQQYSAARKFEFERFEEMHFIQCLVSSTGCRKLEIPAKFIPRDFAFREGMKHASRVHLDDPPVSNWHEAYFSDVDLAFIIASDSMSNIEEETKKISSAINSGSGGGAKIQLIDAATIRDQMDRATDVFGFVDGISQPLFLDYDIVNYSNKHGLTHWDPTMDPKRLVLVPDLVSPGAWGSYCVLRLINQDRSLFERESRLIANTLGASLEEVQAQYFGRYRDGTPIEMYGREIGNVEPDNNFNFDKPNSRSRCPIHAHIRKVNIRNEDDEFAFSQIARRGVPFKYQKDEKIEEGLVFICFQQDISRQFEKQQKAWMNDVNFQEGFGVVGADPVGATRSGSKENPQIWNKNWNMNSEVALRASSFSTCIGGEYFYLPPPDFFGTWAEL